MQESRNGETSLIKALKGSQKITQYRKRPEELEQ